MECQASTRLTVLPYFPPATSALLGRSRSDHSTWRRPRAPTDWYVCLLLGIDWRWNLVSVRGPDQRLLWRYLIGHNVGVASLDHGRIQLRVANLIQSD